MSCLPTEFHLRRLAESDRAWVAEFVADHWAASTIVTRGRVYHSERLPGFVAEAGGQRIGLVTYRFEDDECEVTTLNSVREGIGVGSALLAAVRTTAAERGCRRLWLITTNDNLAAVRFYQKRGWRLVAVYPGAWKWLSEQSQFSATGERAAKTPFHAECECRN